MPLSKLLGPLSVLTTMVATAMLITDAEAGTYKVVACEAAVATNDSWAPVADRGMLAYAKCPSGGQESRGLVMRNDPKASVVSPGATASMTFAAPPGAELADMTYVWRGARANGGWQLGIVGDRGGFLTGCRAGTAVVGQSCSVGYGPQNPRARSIALPGRRSVKFEVRCTSPLGCNIPPARGGSGAGTARLQVYSTSVTVKDDSAPQITAAGGGLWESRWLRGVQEAVFNASDNVGVRATRFTVDGALRNGEERGCDFTRRVPCSNVTGGRYQMDTNSL